MNKVYIVCSQNIASGNLLQVDSENFVRIFDSYEKAKAFIENMSGIKYRKTKNNWRKGSSIFYIEEAKVEIY